MSQNREGFFHAVQRMSTARARLLLLDLMNFELMQVLQDFTDLLRMADGDVERRVEEVNHDLKCASLPLQLHYSGGDILRFLTITGHPEHDREYIGIRIELDVRTPNAPIHIAGVLHKGWLNKECHPRKARELLMQLLAAHLDPSQPKVDLTAELFGSAA